MQKVGKISVKTVFGKVEKPAEKFAAIRFLGIARRMSTGESQFGPWVKFHGDFQAINLTTGEEFVAKQALFPAVISDDLAAMLADESVNEASFGFDLYIAPNDAPIGYEYSAESLIEQQESNPLALLAQSIAKPLPALSAPDSVTADGSESGTKTEPKKPLKKTGAKAA